MQQNCVRNSITNWRFGAVPVTAVKTPWPFAVSTVYWSSQNGKRVRPKPDAGKAVFEKLELVESNCRLPFELTLTFEYDVP